MGDEPDGEREPHSCFRGKNARQRMAHGTEEMKRRSQRSPSSLEQQMVPASQRRKLSFSNSDLNNPQQLQELYEQCVDQVLKGLHPVSRDTAIRLAAIQCFVQFGQYREGADQQNISVHDLLPKEYERREHEKNIVEQYRNLVFVDVVAAKRKYCDICKNLPTYGMIFFEVKEPHGNKMIPRLFGVNKECVMSVDKKTKVVRKSWPLEQLRRWAASPTTFNIDFGDYQDGYYSVKTLEGAKIKKLIAEFVDIILWKKRILDPYGLEGDEGAIMIEEYVLRAKSVPLAAADVEKRVRMASLEEGGQPPKGSPFVPLESHFPRKTPASVSPPIEQPVVQPRMGFAQQFVPEQLRRPLPPKRPVEQLVLPQEFDQYEQLPLTASPTLQAPPMAPILAPVGPQQQIPTQMAPMYQPQIPLIPPQKQPALPQLPSTPPPAKPQHAPPPAVGTQSLPPSLGSSILLSKGSPPWSSMFTTQEVVYEIAIKNGLARRSFEQHYSSSRNLRVSTAIEVSIRRVAECTASLGQPVGVVPLSAEEREMAIQLGEGTIRHRAIVFLASTAQAIEWTSDYWGQPRLGHAQVALVQAADNLCELVQCFRELFSLRQGGQPGVAQTSLLVQMLCNSFKTFLEKLHPESAEKRSAFLSSASHVGECAFALLNVINDEEEALEDQHFYAAMNEAIQAVANVTANLVMQAKNLHILPGDLQNERVIESATVVALYTSELIALSRVLAAIMAHPACQKRVQAAVERVRQATAELLGHARANAFSQFALTGSADHYAQMQKNALGAEMALQQLLEQTLA